MRVVNGTPSSNNRPLPVGAEQVATYIKMGRQRVEGSAYDPYAKYKNPMQAMVRDAMIIASWYNANRKRWTIEQRARVYLMINDIQYGPAIWWRTLLKEGLTPVHYAAAQSWAERYNRGQWVDVRLHPEVRDCVFSLLNTRLKLHKEKDPYTAMLDMLRFAFHGLAKAGKDNALEL
jgi:hypothetical protein